MAPRELVSRDIAWRYSLLYLGTKGEYHCHREFAFPILSQLGGEGYFCSIDIVFCFTIGGFGWSTLLSAISLVHLNFSGR